MAIMEKESPIKPLAKRLETGIESIDAQHRYLFATLALLETAIRKGEGEFQVSKTIENLEKYSKRHFADEEALFDRYSYPDAEAHRVQHRQFIEFVLRLKDVRQWGNTELLALNRSLELWLTEHIMKLDMVYAKFIKSKESS